MKAAQINEYGDASIIKINDVEKPVVKATSAQVEVHASSINPFDSKLRSGMMKDYIHLEFPATLGGDFSGIVTEVGEGVTSVAVGDSVYGQANVVAGDSGAFAEYLITNANHIARKPANLDFKQAAALPLVGVSALQAINDHISLRSGQRLFIHGGAGGIGSIALQLAKHIGAYVAVTATGEDIAYVKELGADEIIDYTTESFIQKLHDFDAVFDTVGGDDFATSLEIVKAGGKAVSMVAQIDEFLPTRHHVTAVHQTTHVTAAYLDILRNLVESGVITARIGNVFPLDGIQAAFTLRDAGKIKGKIVIAIKD